MPGRHFLKWRIGKENEKILESLGLPDAPIEYVASRLPHLALLMMLEEECETSVSIEKRHVSLDRPVDINDDHIFHQLLRKQKESGYIHQDKTGSVYVVEGISGLVKIGRSSNPEKRIRAIETHGGTDMVNIFFTENMIGFEKLERDAHKFFKPHRANGEWFKIGFQEAVDRVTALAGIIGKSPVHDLLSSSQAVKIENQMGKS